MFGGPAWRWKRAEWLLERGCRLSRFDDRIIRDARRYAATLHENRPGIRRSVAIAEAHAIYIGDEPKRWEVEARMLSGLHTRFATLTPREREVMALVTAGLMNKQIAAEIGIAEITVKIHRGHIMRKMTAKSLPDLVRMAEMLGIGPAAGGPQT